MGSLTAASRATGLSASTLSRRMKNLEHSLGVTLFKRTGAEITPTSEARKIMSVMGEALNRFEAAVSSATNLSQATQIAEVLRIGAPCCICDFLLAPWMNAFHDEHPHVRIQLRIQEEAADPDKSDCDIALHCGATTIGSERTERVGSFQRIMVSAPSYLEKAGTPREIEDLRSHRLFHYNGAMSDSIWLWKDGKRHLVPADWAAVTATTTGPLMRLVREGRGIVLSTAVFMCVEDLASGALVRVLPDYHEADKPVSLMFHSERGMRPIVREAAEFLRARWKKTVGLT